MGRPMRDDERRALLLEGTRTAKLSTVRVDGRAHVAPVWFVLDDDVIVLNTDAATVKGKALQRDPRVTLCIDGRYMGEALAEEFRRRNAVDTELLVRVTPTRTITETGVSD